jgi:hypothetical protein
MDFVYENKIKYTFPHIIFIAACVLTAPGGSTTPPTPQPPKKNQRPMEGVFRSPRSPPPRTFETAPVRSALGGDSVALAIRQAP